MHRNLLKLFAFAALAGWAIGAFAGPGKKQYDEFAKKGMIYDDPAWQEYVTKIGERLAKQSPEPNRRFHFTIIDSPDVNAFALPDGYIFVYRGLIPYLESEDQLAAVIGHEIGHVVLHHAAKKTSAATLGKVVGAIGAIVTGVGPVQDVAEQMTAEKVSGYGREMELQADQMGGKLLRKAGYDPFAMIEVIQILKDQETFSTQVAGEAKTYHGLFATHPQNDKRLHDAIAQSEGAQLPDQLAEPVGNFWKNINGFVYGNEAASGVVKDQSYYHEQLRIVVTFPAGWVVSSTNRQVTATAPTGQDAGVITFQKMTTPNKKQTPKNYVLDTLQHDDVLSGEETKIDGNDAYVATLDTKGTKLERNLLAVIYKDNNIYLFKGEVGKSGDPAKFEADFRATLAALRSMVPADLKVANGQRIKVIEAKPGDTFEQLAKRSSIKRYPVETLRLLNGDAPLGEPTPGDFIKIVQ